MVVLAGGKKYPWVGRTDPVNWTPGQWATGFSHDRSGVSSIHMRQPYAWASTVLVLEAYASGNSSAAGISTTGTGVTQIDLLPSYVHQSQATNLRVVHIPKGTSDVDQVPTFTLSGASPTVTVNVRAVGYRVTAITSITPTDNGLKFISGGGNPVTDWAGAPAHAGEIDSAVRKQTFASSPGASDDYLCLAFTWQNSGSSGVNGIGYAWNFTLSQWDTITRVTDSGGNAKLIGVYGILKIGDYVNGSNEIYIRSQSTGSSATQTSVGTPPYVMIGKANPAD